MAHALEAFIRNVPDFPKPGIMFKDITPLMQHHFADLTKAMCEGIDWSKIDTIVGIESRGFILGAAMAIQQGKGFLPVRKKGKLPPPVHAQSYTLEYGTDTLEMAVMDKPSRVLIVDDVLATGGTLRAVLSLCEKNKMDVVGMSVFINLAFLNTFKQDGLPVHSVITY